MIGGPSITARTGPLFIQIGFIFALVSVGVVGGAPSASSAAISQGSWSELHPAVEAAGPPSPRGYHTAIHDLVRDRMVVFGGSAKDPLERQEVWGLSLGWPPMWSEITPSGVSPSGRFGHTAVYDVLRDRMVVFGGRDMNGLRNDVWALALSGSPAWSQLTPAQSPTARENHTAIYDPVRDRMVVFGGIDAGGLRSDVLTLTFSGSPAWSVLAPSGTPPSARQYHSAIYDLVRDRMVIFGGGDGVSTRFNDVQALSFSGTPAWSLLTPSGVPPAARESHTAIYDPPRERMVVFGGFATFLESETWALALSGSPAWSLLAPGGPLPDGRVGHSATYHEDLDRMVIFGSSFPLTNEVWQLAWDEPVSVGDQGPLAEQLMLLPPRPNPFRAQVTFDFELPRSARVVLDVYDVRGRRVRTVEEARLAAGRHSRAWDGLDGTGAPVPEGVYFVRLRSAGMNLRQKAVLIR